MINIDTDIVDFFSKLLEITLTKNFEDRGMCVIVRGRVKIKDKGVIRFFIVI